MRFREAYAKCIEEKETIEFYQIKLTEVYDIIKEDYDTASRRSFNNTYVLFYEYAKRKFSTIQYLNEIIETMVDVVSDEDDDDYLDRQMEKFHEFSRRVECILLLNDRMGNQGEESIGLDIKLPRTNTITDLKKYIDGLEFVFTKCPFFQSGDASLELETAESGSIWLIFGVACASIAVGSVLLNNIAAFIDKCFVIKSHKSTYKRQKQEIENAELVQKEKEELFKNIDRLYRISVENVIRELQASTGCQIHDGDEMGRVEQSFEKMIKMLEQGLKIYSSLNSSQEIKALFAPLEMHYLSIEKEVQKIEEKAETDTE